MSVGQLRGQNIPHAAECFSLLPRVAGVCGPVSYFRIFRANLRRPEGARTEDLHPDGQSMFTKLDIYGRRIRHAAGQDQSFFRVRGLQRRSLTRHRERGVHLLM